MKILQRGLALGIVCAGLAGAWWLHVVRDVELSPQGLRDVVADVGLIAPLLLVTIIAFRPLLGLPSWIVLGVAGLLFGVVGGTAYGVIGGAAGAAMAFWIARVMGRDAVQARLGGALGQIDRYLSQRGAPWLAAYVALPISLLTPIFFTAGVTNMRFVPFTVATAIGFVPRAGMYAFLGQTVAEPTPRNLLIASAIVAASIGVAWLARRYFLPGPRPAADEAGAAERR